MASSEEVAAKMNSKVADEIWKKYEPKCLETQAIVVNEQLKSQTLKMNDGNLIPQIGLGTYLHARVKAYFDRDKDKKINSSESQQEAFESSIRSCIQNHDEDEKQKQQFKNAVVTAIKAGYRHIDTAQGTNPFAASLYKLVKSHHSIHSI